ncbi:MAG: hypothetical protein QME60_01300 [Verrucomicrobiota bacterium]|nr:hypothetical protein [Verrucomicrobiota bacterium]
MVKLLVLLAVLDMVPSLASAQTHVYETAKGTGSVRNVLVNTTAVQLDVSTRALSGLDGVVKRFVLEIFNDDSTNTAFCAFTASVSSTAGNINYGRRIGPRLGWTLAIDQTFQIWCVSDAAAGARLVLTQLY